MSYNEHSGHRHPLACRHTSAVVLPVTLWVELLEMESKNLKHRAKGEPDRASTQPLCSHLPDSAVPQAALGWLRVGFFISDMILQVRVFGGFHETQAQKELFSVDQNSLKQ